MPSSERSRLAPATRAQVDAAIDELVCRDAFFAPVVERAGRCRFRPRDPDGPFGALVRAVVYQQLAGAAAAAIHRRLRGLVDGPLTAQAVLALHEPQLAAAGLSRAKRAAVLDLAVHVASGDIPLDRLRRLSDDEIVARLSAVRGIGRWTAHMFLIFELRRLDVWPVDDLGVRRGFALVHGMDAPPPPRELEVLGDRCRPVRSVAAWYCWQAVGLTRKGENLSLRDL